MLVSDFDILISDFNSVRASIHIPPTLSNLTAGQHVIEVGGRTVGECLDELVVRFPDIKEQLFGTDGRLEKNVEVYVNLKSAYPEELSKAVAEGDEIHIVEMLAGG